MPTSCSTRSSRWSARGEHAEANAALEARVLSEVEDVFVREGGNVAGLIVEPIHRRDLVLLDGIERVVER